MLPQLKTSDFDYPLPEELIAQRPAKERDLSRLMVLDRRTGRINNRTFTDIASYLNPSDVLVLNDTMVIPARLYGIKVAPKRNSSGQGGGARIEVFLHRKVKGRVWEVLARPAKRLKVGTIVRFGKILSARNLGVAPDGKNLLMFKYKGDFENILKKKGVIPLPPYIRDSRHGKDAGKLAKRYQTVYASAKGATAAPTAGLHFTKSLLDNLKGNGVQIEYITLHTGLGTFQPVKTEYIDDHKMHSEEYKVDRNVIKRIMRAKIEGRRIVAVGTTVVRLLESLAKGARTKGETSLFIRPGHEFKIVDAMITNFHLPRSTLIVLVSAFAGQDLIKKAYTQAIRKRYRFFSFGDAMLIV